MTGVHESEKGIDLFFLMRHSRFHDQHLPSEVGLALVRRYLSRIVGEQSGLVEKEIGKLSPKRFVRAFPAYRFPLKEGEPIHRGRKGGLTS